MLSEIGRSAQVNSWFLLDETAGAISFNSSIEITLIPFTFANSINCAPRIIEPSSFTNSQITATGLAPANWQSATPASVWPARCCNPPSTAINGKICPGRAKSDGFEFESPSARKVLARSAAEIPVVRSLITSTDTVKAVEWLSSLRFTIGGNFKALAIALSIAAQITPDV